MILDAVLSEKTEIADKDGLLGEWMKKYHRKVTHVCYGYTKDWEDAREMAQETFLKAYKHLDDFEGRSQPGTWITRIAINQCLSFLAAKGRERAGLSKYAHEQAREEHEGGARAEAIRVAIGRLIRSTDPVTRRVLDLAMAHGLSHSQIATTMGVSRVAVTRRITRFKRKALSRIGR